MINVPPKLLFDAGVFKPGRLCAVYELEWDESLSVSSMDAELGEVSNSVIEFAEDKEHEQEQEQEQDPWKGLGSTISEMFAAEQNPDSVDEEDDDFNFDDYMV